MKWWERPGSCGRSRPHGACWIPAFAGMTPWLLEGARRNSCRWHQPVPNHRVIPAKAGISVYSRAPSQATNRDSRFRGNDPVGETEGAP